MEHSNDKNLRVVIHEDKRPQGQHHRRYNAPLPSGEIGILMPNDPCETRDIVLHERDGQLQFISELHRAYDTLQYPVFFPYGTDGWSVYIQNEASKKITQMQYYSYHLMCRPSNYIILGRRLFQQFLVDIYCKIETERLSFLRREQKTLRADSYQIMRDAILLDDCDPCSIGQKYILPSSFVGGPRYMHERNQDAIAYVRKFGKPSLFITSTTNPKWAEIMENLLPHQSPVDRPDIVARVFHQKLKKLMCILKDGAFGRVQAYLYAVEFQKRGLPHVHILLWLKSEDIIRPDKIDDVVSAEIPPPDTEPKLHDIVRANMIHGPCGPLNPNSPCMKDGRCTKAFPKEFRQETQQGQCSYPLY